MFRDVTEAWRKERRLAAFARAASSLAYAGSLQQVLDRVAAGELDLAKQWFAKAHAYDPAARYPYLMWNCLWRAGGSIVHGHMQMTAAS
jgi:hypothetical protein